MAFDQSTRNRLARFVSDARRILTDEFTRQCKQDYGIDPDTSEVSDVARLTHLNDTQRATARILRETLDHYVAGSPSGGKKASIDRIIREQAFTTLNRLCAVRMAEARGIVIESVGKGPQSKGFSLYARVAGSALGETADAYRCYLFSIFDEIALDLPPLFDRFSPKGRLFPSATALDSLLAEINHVDLDPLWGEDETIGWLYQYFNSIEERKQMRDESAAPRNSRELAVRNQFFTPRYVVEFLTDNTLGRIWYEMTNGETALKDTCRYLVRRPSEVFLAEGQEAPAQEQATDNLSQEELLKQPVHIPHRPLKDPREIRLLDPACGSMHFGLYAFDLFTTIYDNAWELARGPADNRPQSPAFADFIPFAATFKDKSAFLREVPRLIIEHNIHGIDIDPRAVQIAGLSLWLRAQRAWHQTGLKPAERPRITRSHIVCAEPMPGEKALLQEFVQQQFQEGERPVFGFLLEQVVDQMKLAGEAGSLLRIEESISTSIAEAKRRWRAGPKYEQSPLFPEAVTKPGQGQMRLDLSGVTDEQFWERAEQRIYEALRAYSETAENGGGFQRRLFANDAAQGFALIDLFRTQYDAVVMNPPFGDASLASKPYVDAEYPTSKTDVGMAFVSRWCSRLDASGRLGAITNRVCLANEKLEKWRKDFLLGERATLDAMIDLGIGVLDALVEAVAYVLTPVTATVSQSALVGRALNSRDKEATVKALVQLRGTESGTLHLVARDTILAVPSSILCYWLPAASLGLISRGRRLSDIGMTAKQGLASGDDFRFFRLWWEVPVGDIATSGPLQASAWVPLAKGGEYAPLIDDPHLLVDWRRGGGAMKAYVSGRYPYLNGDWGWVVKNSEYYFQRGLTYPARTASDFCPRILPSGCVFSAKGQAILGGSDDDVLLYAVSSFTRFYKSIVEAMLGSGDSSVSGSAAKDIRSGLLNDLPHPLPPQYVGDQVIRRIRRVVQMARSLSYWDETSRHFASVWAERDDRTVKGEGLSRVRNRCVYTVELCSLNQELETLQQSAFRMSADDWSQLCTLSGQHPLEYATVDSRREEICRLASLTESQLVAECVRLCGASRQVTKKAYIADRQLELIAHASRTSVATIASDEAVQTIMARQTQSGTAHSIVSYAVGVAFGRWDPKHGTRVVREAMEADVFAPLPQQAPGECRASNINENWTAVLCAAASKSMPSIVSRVREWIDTAAGNGGQLEHEVCQSLGVSTLEEYIEHASGFFASHYSQYSRSRRQAPIYWPLSTPSGSYTLWLYYHRLSDQTLFKAVNDFVDPALQQIASQAATLRGRTSRSSADNAELERLSDFEIELTEFHDELLRLAKMWKPNLNDGVVITASPLWKLFQYKPWQRRLKETWDALGAGEYDWAHLAYSLWPDRVREKCKHDKSLAIAHGLEELYQEPPATAGKKRGRKPKAVDPELMEDAE